MNFSNLNRNSLCQQLESQQFDLLVIGGGITGCGIALDAALRGLKTALIEKNDFASGTSSRSTKLIHGGLRYLKQLEFKLVRDVGSERAVVHRNARHIVIPEKMLLPIIEGGELGTFSTSVGLLVYDLLAGVKRSERRIMLNRHATHRAEPLLSYEGLLGGGLYYEYRTDDSRLVIEIAKSAFANKAVLLNYTEAQHFTYNEEGKINGLTSVDKITGKPLVIRAKTVVNACGPWVDLLRKEDKSLQGKRLQLTKGVHLVFPYHKLPLRQAAYFDVRDGRMIFAIPRNNITYVGTTDTVYNQDLNKPQCTREDARYLLNAVNKMFPSVNLQMEDIISSWAGLRPLIYEEGKSASELSRKDEIMVSGSGLISIAGGKLTGYRLMAEKIVALVTKKLARDFGPCKTKNFRLSGGEFADEVEFKVALENLVEKGLGINLPAQQTKEWFYRYGNNTSQIIKNVELLRSSVPDDRLLAIAELLYGIEHEMVYHLNDFMVRRTGKIFFDIENSSQQIDYLANYLSDKFISGGDTFSNSLHSIKEEFELAISFL